MVERVAGEGQAPAFDGVGENHRRPVRRLQSLADHVDQILQVVAAEVGQQARQLLVRHVLDDPGDLLAALAVDAAARRRRLPSSRISVWYSSLPMSSIAWRSASPPGLANASRKAPAILHLEHPPAALGEQPLQLGGADAGDDAVEALAVEVDDPEDVVDAARALPRSAPPRCCPRPARRRRSGR